MSSATASRPTPLAIVGVVLAMTAFAANSLLTRAALDGSATDAASFTLLRLASGALVLAVIVRVRAQPQLQGRSPPAPVRAAWRSAAFLFGYAAAFSVAYLRIGAAVGALALFGTVQTVMYTVAVVRGERPGPNGWMGLVLATVGLVALVSPGVNAPDATGVGLMIVAGVCWAGYTLAGRATTDPIASTARNFAWSLPFAAVLELGTWVVRRNALHADGRGIALSVASGAIASGLGYAIWYAVLPALSRVQAGIVQMAPPPLAAIGGLVLLGERLTVRVALASALILTGVAVGVIRTRAP